MRKTYTILAWTGAFAMIIAGGCGGASSGSPGAGPTPGDEGDRPGGRETGAVATVSDREETSLTIEEYLRGQVPGLEVIPGRDGGFTLRIRGINPSLLEGGSDPQPLVIIDDVPLSASAVSSALGNLNPGDIRDVRVLRDVASTSIYGTRGAAGVVLIRTRD